MILAGFLILSLYVLLIGSFYLGMFRLKHPELKLNTSETSFSIIIPFRDEATYLPALLQSLKQIKYNLKQFEILLINDSSEDNSESIVTDFISKNTDLQIRLFQNKRFSCSPKKDAITLGISKSKYDWIITTDADCMIQKLWLKQFNDLIQTKNFKLIVAPVTYFCTNQFLNIFQWFDLISLQGITMGSFGLNRPLLCNGANLAYSKTAFYDVNGFTNNLDIASGDDIFLLEKISRKHPEQIGYLKATESTVFTHAQPTLLDLIHQRKRWASKTKAYQNQFSKFTGLLVFITNAFLIILVLLGIMGKINLNIFLLFTSLKFGIDFLIILKSAIFFQQIKPLKWYIIVACIYPFFCTFIASASMFTTYKWKDRIFAQ